MTIANIKKKNWRFPVNIPHEHTSIYKRMLNISCQHADI